MERPVVSVVMVVCNADRFLAESIESILSQSFRDFEFIIVDFGSTDRSKSIAARYAAQDSRVKLHEIPHCGLVAARNAGSSFAQGQYIAVMDADDVAEPERLMQQVAFLDASPKVALLGGASEWINASGQQLRIDTPPTEDSEIRAALLVRCPFCQPTVLIRREAFLLLGGYREIFAQAEDYDLWLRLSEHFDVANLRQVVLKYRIHPFQLTLRMRMQQTLCVLAAQYSATARRNRDPDPLDAAEQITPELLAAGGISEATQQVTAASDYLVWLRSLRQAGEFSSAREAASRLLGSPDRKYLERWQIADVYLAIAGSYWKERKRLRSILAAGRAVATRPLLIGRPLKPVLQLLGLT